MTNSKKHTKRALLSSALSLLLCITMLIGTTWAWFTDSVTSAGNIIKSGTLDVEMSWADGKENPDSAAWKDASTGAIFDYDLWEPGYVDVKHVKIANVGTLAFKYQIAIKANGELETIRKNIEGLDYADEIPAFEKYIPAVEPADSTEDSSSSAAQDSLEEEVSSSSSSKEEPRDTTVTSSSSEVAADTASSSSVVPPVSSSSVRDSLLSSSSVRDSLSQDSLRSSSSIVPKDSVVRDSIVRDTTVRDTSARDSGSVKPDTSITKKDSSVIKKDTSGCPNTEFPHELSNLLGNGYEIASARCPGDSVVVTWRTRHDVYETEFSVPRTYTFAADFEQYSTDSLDRFRSEWLGRGSGFEFGKEHDESIVDLGNELYDYPYDEEDLSEIGETTPVYSYRMDLKNASYLVYVFSVPQVLVSASGSRTIRYGFVVELVGVYYMSK